MLKSAGYKNNTSFGAKVKIFDNNMSSQYKKQLKSVTKSIKKKENELINTNLKKDKFVPEAKKDINEPKREETMIINPYSGMFVNFENPIEWLINSFMH